MLTPVRTLGSHMRSIAAGGGRAPVPTTAAGAEIALLIAFLGLRVVDLFLLAIGTPVALERSPCPALAAVVEVAFWLESIVVCATCWRRRRYDSPGIAWLETASGAAVLVTSRWYTLPVDRFSSWADWGYPVGLSVALGLGIGLQRWRWTLTAAAALAASYWSTVSGIQSVGNSVATALTNATSFFTFAVVPLVFSRYLRRLGRDADLARELAVEQGEQLERLRQQALLHSNETTLRQLSAAAHLPPELDRLRAQALAGAQEIRAFLTGERAAPTGLAAALAGVVATFPDLEITLNTDLAGRELPDRHVEVLVEAVRTLLENVRRHAGTASVVLHAETREHEWEVTVADDGDGFDPQDSHPRFGLTELVVRRVHALGGRVELHSARGEGTLVRMSGAP